MIIGLTGQTGAGKTLISSILEKQKGIAVIDCDKLARRVVMNGSECLLRLAIEFSPLIIDREGGLNRKKLGEIVFSDREKLNKLNEMIFPYILKDLEIIIEELKRQGAKTIVIDAPTLFESGADKMCDKIVVVVADETIRLARIMERDNLSVEMATNRMNSQRSQEFFVKHADFVIENSDDKASLAKSIMELLEKIKNNFE